MAKIRGYNQKLFILPFDHRGYLLDKMFGIKGRKPTPKEKQVIIEAKKIIYAGFRLAVDQSLIPKAAAGILVDEEFGSDILRDAHQRGYIVCLPVEKTSQVEFTLEYGSQFGAHIQKYQPTMVKALVRYNPADSKRLNIRQQQTLKKVNDYCQRQGYPFIIEPLVPATTAQLKKVNGNQKLYDQKLRPGLMVQMVRELQNGGVEPDIWKVEGLDKSADYQKVVKQMQSGGRQNVRAIILGRASSDQGLVRWLKAGRKVKGVIGFAIGRTIFWQPLVDHLEKKISRVEAVKRISQKYYYFYKIFNQK
ncbi:MAG: DUF2090 domain-containing protein [Patescibacteria group bacterium]